MNIYDCFMYFDEDLLLDIRLNTLNKYVKKFVITEATYTHNGDRKNLRFDINNFSKFKDKISYIVVDRQPDNIKEILKSDLGITPVTTGDIIRIPLPPLTEENRRDLAKVAKTEAENARIAIRNIRRDAIADCKELVKEKMIAEDDGRKGEERVQGITDSRISEVDQLLATKETDLMQI